MAPACYIVHLGLPNHSVKKRLNNFLKKVKKPPCQRPSSWVSAPGPPMAQEDGEEKRDLRPGAPGIRMPQGTSQSLELGAPQLGAPAFGGDHTPSAPIASTFDPNWDGSKISEFSPLCSYQNGSPSFSEANTGSGSCNEPRLSEILCKVSKVKEGNGTLNGNVSIFSKNHRREQRIHLKHITKCYLIS